MGWDFVSLTKVFINPQQSRLLLDGKWGLEKESQRITSSGHLALTDHPAVFGNKQTHPYITTDFAESQLELITPPHRTMEATFESLQTIHTEVIHGLGNELLWPLSMPPRLPRDEADIPIARFDDSPEGREKELYRQGLALRYGKKMQMISGLHYNFSFGDKLLDLLYRKFGQKSQSKRQFTDDLYFALARNFLRYRWLLIYLFGASPIADDTYESVIREQLEIIAGCCPDYAALIEKEQHYATSLRVSRFGYSERVSRFGYSNPVSASYHAYFNDLETYIRNLRKLLSTKSREYEDLGVFQDGIQVQLNDNILQKESEFYAAIRFKQIAKPHKTQLDLLDENGIQYLEVRILDLNPFEKTEISLQQLYFLQVFILLCLFESKEPFTEKEFIQSNQNHHLVALFGRKPDLTIDHYQHGQISLGNWSREIFKKLTIIARLIDMGTGGQKYQNSIIREYQKIIDPSLLPSARIIHEMADHHETFLQFGTRRALINKKSNRKSQMPGINCQHQTPHKRRNNKNSESLKPIAHKAKIPNAC
jgi:glutamate--cysteine ligase